MEWNYPDFLLQNYYPNTFESVGTYPSDGKVTFFSSYGFES